MPESDTYAVVNGTGTGASIVVVIPWEYDEDSELVVWAKNAVTGALKYASLGEVTYVLAEDGLSITATNPWSGTSAVVYVARETPKTQEASLTGSQPADRNAAMTALDKLTRVVQDIFEKLGAGDADFAVVSPDPFTVPGAIPRINTMLGFDAAGAPTLLAATANGVLIVLEDGTFAVANLTDDNISASAGIAWGKIKKDGSSIADLAAHAHALLTGLDADDHTQYLTAGRGNALYALLAHVHAGVYDPAGSAAAALEAAEAYTDEQIAAVAAATDHAKLDHLEYEKAGHTGFAPTAHTHAHNDTTGKQGGATNAYNHITNPEAGVVAGLNAPTEVGQALSDSDELLIRKYAGEPGVVNTPRKAPLGTRLLTWISAKLAAFTAKEIPIPADSIPVVDSAASNAMKLSTIAQLRQANANSQADAYTLVLGDGGKLLEMTKGSASQLLIPANGSVAFPTDTTILAVFTGAAGGTIKGDTGVTVNGVSGGTVTLTAYQMAALIKRGTNTWLVPNFTAA